MSLPNPFTPTFGQVPQNMAGRNRIIAEMSRAFDAANRTPELTTLISGARGCGKTTLLTRISEEAAIRGWVCVNVVAAPGMLDDILIQATDKAAHLLEPAASTRLTELGMGQLVNVGWEHDEAPTNWRLKMQRLLEGLAETGAGLAVFVDEIDPSIEEAIQLASTYQLFVTENRRISLIMAGLPYNIEKAKSNRRISFVRRAQQRHLGRIDDLEVAESMRKTVQQAGRTIGDAALRLAVSSAQGFPFMIQLVGYRMWDLSPENAEISAEDARLGAELAQAEFRSYVLESTYRDLSDGDIAFLKAMLVDDAQSNMKDIAKRMGKSTSYASTYRERLLRQGVIAEPDRNAVGFELPGFKDFLIERLGIDPAK